MPPPGGERSGGAAACVRSGACVTADYQNGAAPSAPTREYIYSGGGLLAKIESGAVEYYHPDQLSVRLMTDSSGSVIGQQGHYPFGESWYQSSTTTKWFFTSYERDSESGNDYAMARYGVNRLGRFASPDPIAGSRSDPQSLNRHAYVLNDPVSHVDPVGLDCNWTNPDEPCNGGSGDGAPVFADWSITGLDGGYLVDGFIPVSASLAGNLLQSGAGMECPGDVCGRWVNGQYQQFFCTDICGYLTQQQQYTMTYDCGGSFCDSYGHLQWALQNDPGAAAGQFQATAKALADKLKISVADAMTLLIEDLYGGNSSTAELSGGNLNFWVPDAYENDLCLGSNAGCRLNDGLHIHGSPGSYYVHLDTADPFSSVGGFFQHTWTDVFGGNVAYNIIPRR